MKDIAAKSKTKEIIEKHGYQIRIQNADESYSKAFEIIMRA